MAIRLSNVIREWRRGSGKSLGVVSREMNVPKSVLARIETGAKQGDGTRGLGMDGGSLSRVVIWLLSEESKIDTGVKL